MSKRKVIINLVIAFLLLCICAGALWMAQRSKPKPAKLPDGMEYLIGDTVAVGHFEYINDMEFFAGDWDGDYDLQLLYGPEARNSWCTGTVMDYETYERFCAGSAPAGYVQAYHDPSLHYLVYGVWWEFDTTPQARLAAVTYSGMSAHMYVWDRFENDPAKTPGCAYVIVVPTAEDMTYLAVHKLYYTVDQYAEAKEYDIDCPAPEKPIIYLYPERETDVTVTLGHPECITHSYPEYDGPWRVSAQPDGTLTELKTGRELYSLYYENVSPVPLQASGEGFVVRGEDTAAFLEETLAILGLSAREAEEFIVYWLPRLEGSAWNYIRFASPDEIDAEMPLGIEPQPDSVIRVLMLWQPLDVPIEVQPQALYTPPRMGFTAVEWGGAELH